MSPAFAAFLRSWPYDPWLCAALVLSAVVYLRGWRRLHRHDPRRWPAGRAVAFVAGLVTIFLALASPIEAFADLLLQVHMLQHLLLLMVAPPLIWLACAVAADVARAAKGGSHGVGGAAGAIAAGARPLRHAHASASGLAGVCRRYVALAHAARVRIGARRPHLARGRACQLYDRGLVVLVSGDRAVSEPADVVAVDRAAVPDSGRRAEHGAGGLAVVFVAADLSCITPKCRGLAVGRRWRTSTRPAC